MAVIQLKSQYVSLIVIFISAASEFALSFAALRWNCVFENKTLQKRGSINVRNHQTRTRLLIAATTAVFIIIEVLFSHYSEPTTTERWEKKNCTFLSSRREGGQGFTNLTSMSSIILLRCLETEGTVIKQSAGNLFRDAEQIVTQCSDLLYSFSTDNAPKESLPAADYFKECVLYPEQAAPENQTEACVFLYTNGPKVTFTYFVNSSEVSLATDKKIPLVVWHTDVYFNFTGLENEFAKRAAIMFFDSIPHPITLRREVFTADGEGMCDFKNRDDATIVPDGFMYAFLTISALCLLSVVPSLYFSSHICFDISNPLHWPQKTVPRESFLGCENPVVSRLHLAEEMFVVSSDLAKPRSVRWRP